MKRLLEYDPVTKTKTWFEGDGYGGFHIAQEQDVEGIINYCQALKNDSEYKKKGIKEDWYHFATIPNTILHEILIKHNLDFNRKEDMPKIESVIQTEYPKLMTVNRI